ncbi:hypothetical protein [Desulfallas thermosapovorans]|uniref:Uncharacterized protein n=1 Tax=Desulfallas thermosapovorans DSM 6562 TaxID=1121431 RepID=A0A5S5A067_9FIRM|nr:hypothetical protein [Desulfallas thermosapovorans]TYO97777.1 hypothetical protein LX24_00060 [Desulfallas thermosapovorans DSM 6562]
MFFESWWQGLVFGVVTSIALLAICYGFAIKWSKFTGEDKKQKQSCNAHH